jgi:hypothetical protein
MIDDDELRFFPIGYRATLLVAALTKRAVLTEQCTVGERLELLEGLGRLVDNCFTALVLAVIRPACDTAIAMMREARTLDAPGAHCEASFKVLTSPEVFREFLRLNPSLIAAIRQMPGYAAMTHHA